MKIGELSQRDANFPTVADLVAREISIARSSYPNAIDDIQALAFATSSLRKNLVERTQERDARNRQIAEMTGRVYIDG